MNHRKRFLKIEYYNFVHSEIKLQVRTNFNLHEVKKSNTSLNRTQHPKLCVA